MIKFSESLAKMAPALAKVGAKLKNPPKNKTGQARGAQYQYADLGCVLEAKFILADEGLSLSQWLNGDGATLVVTTLLLHTSGEWVLSDTAVALPVNCTPQTYGTYVTYTRRYAAQAALAITGEDDDDAATVEHGNGKSQATQGVASPAPKAQAQPPAPRAPQSQPAASNEPPADTEDEKVLADVIIGKYFAQDGKKPHAIVLDEASGGDRYSWFDDRDGHNHYLKDEAAKAKQSGQPVNLRIKRHGNFWNVAGINDVDLAF